MFTLGSQCRFHQRMEIFVEHFHHVGPFLFSFGHLIKLLFHTGRKVIIHNLREILHQEVIDHTTYVGRYQFRLFASAHFRLHGFFYFFSCQLQQHILTLHAFLVTFFYIPSLLDGRNGRCISRRTTDTQFLQFTYQAGFRVAGWSLTEALYSRNFFPLQYLSDFHLRQSHFIFLFRFIVERFLVNLQEAIESHDFAYRLEFIATPTDGDGSRCFFQFRVCHLRSQRTLPNQFIQVYFLRGSFDGFIRHISRTNGFMRFLCALCLGRILTGMYITFSHQVKYGITACCQGQFR